MASGSATCTRSCRACATPAHRCRRSASSSAAASDACRAAPLPSMNPLEAWVKPPDSGLRATWLGHSTVLIEIDGLRVLTDPVWGPRASPSRWLGPKRFQPVPVALRELPPIDVVLVSHDHYDHLDYPTIRELAKRDVPFVTSLGVGAHLEAWGVPPRAHRRARLVGVAHAAERRTHGDRRAVATLLRARPARIATRRCGPRWSSARQACGVLQRRHRAHDRVSDDPRAARAVRPGDAGGGRVPSRVGRHPPRAARTRSKALALLGGGAFLPVHWGTFSLAMHAWDQPAEALLELAPKTGAQLLMPRLGEPIEPAHTERCRAVVARSSTRSHEDRSPRHHRSQLCRKRCPGRSTRGRRRAASTRSFEFPAD